MRSCVGQIWEESDPRYITKSTEVRLRSFTTKVHKVDRVTALCHCEARRLPWTRSTLSAQPCWPRPIAAAVVFSEACTHPLPHPHRDVTQCHTRDMTRRGCYTRWGRVHTGPPPPHGSTHRREEGTGPLSLTRWRWSRTEQKTSAHAHAARPQCRRRLPCGWANFHDVLYPDVWGVQCTTKRQASRIEQPSKRSETVAGS